MWKHKRYQKAITILRKKDRAGGIMLLDFTLYNKKPQQSKQYGTDKNRHMDPWNRMESTEINPHNYSQLIYDKGSQNIQY